uniref:Nucleoside diphosphate kinase-like domain-containing protein n=1 Tax=Romanomermis culicivorax TaxID=13658 RepID=A0A915IHI4_ROMCU
MLERTLAIIKPEAISHESQIHFEIANAGLSIVAKKHVLLTKDQCEDFLIQQKNDPNFKSTCQSMCSDTCTILILEGQNAVRLWLEMLGPDDVDQARRTDPDL